MGLRTSLDALDNSGVPVGNQNPLRQIPIPYRVLCVRKYVNNSDESKPTVLILFVNWF